MKKTRINISTIACLALLFTAAAQAFSQDIVPIPMHQEVAAGNLKISSQSRLVIVNEELLPVADFLSDYIKRLTGHQLTIVDGADKTGNIFLSIDPSLKREEYHLSVGDYVQLQGADYAALAQGAASLIQSIVNRDGEYVIPRLEIKDRPQFQYRAVLLDLARFWHPVETIRQTIDMLWFYKIKYLHLHLSDNRRFTFPMEEYPELRKINPDGSVEFYTRTQLEDLVEYAGKRGVAIIPEIDLPGHSQSLWKTLPETFGAVDVETGQAKNLYVVNMAKEETYEAIERIIERLSEVFYTSPYIHVGGDEVYLDPITKLPEYKDYCKKHGLQKALEGDANELFCHFINRLNSMVKKTGKQTIVWEGFHGTGAGAVEIDKDITVIVWNTTYNHPKTLQDNGYKLINSTWIPWYQVGAMNFAPEPHTAYKWDVDQWAHWNTDIKDIKLASKKGIIGGQISFWEQTYDQVIEVLKTRVPVLSDRLWSNDAVQDFEQYKDRARHASSVYDRLFQPVVIQGENLTQNGDARFENNTKINLTQRSEGTVKYALTHQWGLPDKKAYVVYEKPFKISESTLVSAQVFDDEDNPVGYSVQQFYSRIEPAYRYSVYRSTHHTQSLPDLGNLNLLRQGVTGKMTPERLKHINRELFAKVKTEGHIDTRFEGIYNPYAVELSGTLKIPDDGQYDWQMHTWDGLAELYINGQLTGSSKDFDNKPEYFQVFLKKGKYPFEIRYYYKNIQNQLSIQFKKEGEETYKHFDELVVPLKKI